MKLKKRLKFTVFSVILLIAAISITVFTVLSQATPEDKLDFNKANVLTKVESDAAEDYYLGKIDELILPPGLLWWQDTVRLTNNDRAPSVFLPGIAADCATVGAYYADEGRAPFFREHSTHFDMSRTKAEYIAADFKKLAWIEGNGDSRTFIIGVTKNNGVYDTNSSLSPFVAPRMTHSWWNWRTGPANDTEALNVEPNWSGMHTFVNNEAWLMDFGQTNYNAYLTSIGWPTIDIPAYPDGTPANTGYLPGYDKTRPDKAILYDACGSKNIKGDPWTPGGDTAERDGLTNFYGLIEIAPNRHYGDISIGKDLSAPFWRSYNQNVVRYFLNEGADGFWIDNYIGFDAISQVPNDKAFGDWSVYKFNEFIQAKSPSVYSKMTATAPDIYQYVREIFRNKGWGNPDTANTFGGNWHNQFWLDDPVWKAYLAFLSLSASEGMYNRYNDIKAIAADMGKDPDQILVTGNDFCLMHYAAVTGDNLDLVSTEYENGWNVITGSNYNAELPRGRVTGVFSLVAASTQTPRASIWFYQRNQDRSNINMVNALGYVSGYLSLAVNVTLNSGEGLPVPGNNNTARKINEDIGKLKPYIGARISSGDVAVLYSGNSEMAIMAPGGYVNGDSNNFATGYLGWCYALEDLGVQYRAMQEWQLNGAGGDLYSQVKCLIMPNTLSVGQNTVDSVLIPFLNNGGTIILTGSMSQIGKFDVRENIYNIHGGLNNANSPLVKLYNNPLYKGTSIKWASVDPAADYYINHKAGDKVSMTAKLNAVAALLSTVSNYNQLSKVTRTGFVPSSYLNDSSKPSVYAFANYDKNSEIFMIDLVNTNTQNDMKGMASRSATNGNASIVVDLPAGKTVSTVMAFNADTGSFTNISSYSVSGGKLTVSNIPAFDYYYTIIVQ